MLRFFRRIQRLAGEGCFWGHKTYTVFAEMRIDYGPGYRVYYLDTGEEIIILLFGGDKTTQR